MIAGQILAQMEGRAAGNDDVPVLVSALRAVLSLHVRGDRKMGGVICEECRILWPCRTVQVVEGQLNLPTG